MHDATVDDPHRSSAPARTVAPLAARFSRFPGAGVDDGTVDGFRPSTAVADGALAEDLDHEDDPAPEQPNRLLQLLSREAPEEHAALCARLEYVTVARGAVFYEPCSPVPYVDFPQTCVASIVKIMADGRRLEVGTTGCEGMVGVPVFLGAESTPFQCFAQVAGSVWRLRAAELPEVAAAGSALHHMLQRYAQYLYDQTGQSVACGQLHAVNERCARWLLMTHDRVGHAESFPLTHAFLAIMLGVRRASVSVAAESLQAAGLIHYRRGRISIVDREGLESASCECYGSDRSDYRRLLG